jgi:hypothetical protein
VDGDHQVRPVSTASAAGGRARRRSFSSFSRLVAVFAVFVSAACTSSGGAGPDQRTGGGWFQARPLIMPGQHTTTAHSESFGSLRVPTSEASYSRLSRAQRAALTNALRSVDCARPPTIPGSADRVVCDADRDAFLLGAPLFTGNDVTKADTIAPSASVQGWEVSFSLTPTAANKLYRWTSQHHSEVQSGVFNDVQTSSKPPCGVFRLVPCAAFAAYISNGLVVTVQVWFAAAGYRLVIQGAFHKAFAVRLSQRLNS